MNKKMILLVEDNKKVQNFNRQLLERRGFTVYTAMTLADAGASLARQTPDIIVLDIGMPDGSGLNFLRELRETSKIPVLMLTGYGEDKDVVTGFTVGCDDYLTKPYTFEVLLVRINNLLKKSEQVPETVTKGRLELKLTPMTALIDGFDILLSQKEFALLVLFTQNEGRSMSAEYLYEKIWGQQMNCDDSAIKNMIYRLRKKLENSGYTIVFTRGEGYKFEME